MKKYFEVNKKGTDYTLMFNKQIIHEKYFSSEREAVDYFKNYVTSFRNISSSIYFNFKSAYDNGDIANHKRSK